MSPELHLWTSAPASTRVRVHKGDRLKIVASGVVEWKNYNTTSTPIGVTNHGQWQGINSGTLVGRIGKSGSTVCDRYGRNDRFAKESGVLYLGIAMRAEPYAEQRDAMGWGVQCQNSGRSKV